MYDERGPTDAGPSRPLRVRRCSSAQWIVRRTPALLDRRRNNRAPAPSDRRRHDLARPVPPDMRRTCPFGQPHKRTREELPAKNVDRKRRRGGSGMRQRPAASSPTIPCAQNQHSNETGPGHARFTELPWGGPGMGWPPIPQRRRGAKRRDGARTRRPPHARTTTRQFPAKCPPGYSEIGHPRWCSSMRWRWAISEGATSSPTASRATAKAARSGGARRGQSLSGMSRSGVRKLAV